MSRSPGGKLNPCGRRIIAEDADWSLVLVPSLSTLCLQNIMENFDKCPIFDELTPVQREFVHERLSTSLPLSVTANLISDGVYWKRCCEQRWDLCDVSLYDHSWKRMFFERHLEKMIELFIPEVTETERVLEMIPLCENYVKRLEISQLLPPVKQPVKVEEDYGSELAVENEYDRPSMDHFDFNILLPKLAGLQELHLAYRVKQCGMNFEWKMFEMTASDCECLAKALTSCKNLKLLKLYESHIDDKKCRLLVKHLLDHPSLRELDFSYNMIGDRGARAVAKLLNRSKLETLNMYENNISHLGAKAIAHALSKNSSLLSLNLCLNRLNDEGGQAIGKALMNNKSLLHLNLGASGVMGLTSIALAKVIADNNTLKSLNLSGNSLGVDGGRALEEAMSNNSSLTECDVQLTKMDEESVSFITKVVQANRRAEKKRLEDKKT